MLSDTLILCGVGFSSAETLGRRLLQFVIIDTVRVVCEAGST